MTVMYLDPRAEPGVPIEGYSLRIDPDDFSGTVTVLANGFPDSIPFAASLAEELEAHLPSATVLRRNKGSPIRSASVLSADERRSLVGECDAVVAVYGH